jgi:predicted nucleic acid-binding protein
LAAQLSVAAASHLVRLECLVKPLMQNDQPLVNRFEVFFSNPDITMVDLSGAVCRRAAQIRAKHRFQLGEALNLAAAVEGGCGRFLTADARLSSFPDVPVEVLI